MALSPQNPRLNKAELNPDTDLIEIFDASAGQVKNITPSALLSPPAGTAGQIQFSDGSAFAADSNLYWDNTNKRLGVVTSSPSCNLEVRGTSYFGFVGSNDGRLQVGNNNGGIVLNNMNLSSLGLKSGAWMTSRGVGITFRTSDGEPLNGVPLGVIGSGSTSATTSLLVQNSSGAAALTVKDDLSATFGGGVVGIIGSVSNVTYGVNGSNNGMYNPGGNSVGLVTAGVSRVYIDGSNINIATPLAISNSVTNSPNASAQLDVSSTTKGFLPPRMTTTQKNAISSPAEGLMVMDITTHKLCVYDGTSWVDLH